MYSYTANVADNGNLYDVRFFGPGLDEYGHNVQYVGSDKALDQIIEMLNIAFRKGQMFEFAKTKFQRVG